MSTESINLSIPGEIAAEPSNRILRHPGQSISTEASKLVKEARTLRETFGFRELLSLIAVIISLIGMAIVIIGPLMKQSELNAASKISVDTLAARREEDRTATDKAISEAVTRIESRIGENVSLAREAVGIAQQTQADVRTMRQSFDQQTAELRVDTKALWNWAGKLENKLAIIEAKEEARRAREKQED